ncbi:DUF3857 domain-containing protein [Alkalicaulis satelles]|nr:DUF3857 domain-containing protein [Alkalicaulis satelles]
MWVWLRAVLAGMLAAGASGGVLWLAGEAGIENARGAALPGVVIARDGAQRLYRAPLPHWAPPMSEAREGAGAEASGQAATLQGLQFEQVEQHVWLGDSRPVALTRFRVRATTSSAADQLAVMTRIPFLPGHQQAIVHEAVIVRGRERIDVTGDVAVQFARPGMDARTLSLTGVSEAQLRLPGVRRGDAIEVTVAVRGNHRLTDRFDVSAAIAAPGAAVGHHRVTATGPAGAMSLSHDVIRRERAGEGLERLVLHDGAFTPQWPEPYSAPWRQTGGYRIISRMPSWRPLADWQARLYRPDVTPGVEAIARTIAEAHDERADRITAALRYAQREIRYFALALGDGGYVPRSVSETLRLSEGDCKAKTLLLISILDALDIGAVPVLVHTRLGAGLDRLPVTSGAFDHVIAGVEHEGVWYWLDPSWREQPGALTRIGHHDYGWGLIARPGEDALTRLTPPAPPAPDLMLEESYVLDTDGAADFTAQWAFAGAMADIMRQAADEQGRQAHLDYFTRQYANRFEEAAFEPGPQARDVRARNEYQLSFSGRIRLRDLRAQEARQAGQDSPAVVIAPHAALAPVQIVDMRDRAAPVYISQARHVRHRVRVTLPEGWAPPEAFEARFATALFTLDQSLAPFAHDGAPADDASGFVLEMAYQLHPGEYSAAQQLDSIGALKRALARSHVWLPGGEGGGVISDAAALDAASAPGLPALPAWQDGSMPGSPLDAGRIPVAIAY